jgi:dienelactone hydrolase
MLRRLAFSALAFAAALVPGALPPPERLHAPGLVQESVWIPAPGGYSIATHVLRPPGRGPFPAIVLNHGTPVTYAERQRESPRLLRHAALAFARSGYAVFMPLRRGFGRTGGIYAEYPGPCPRPDYLRGEAAAADDVMAAYEHARRQPYVDGSRMILAGQSAGGIAALYAAGTRFPQGLRAVLAFSAGRGGNPMRHPGVPCAVEPLAKVFADLGARVEVPVLFHYAANDRFFNSETSRLWFERFSDGGAQADYVLQPPFGDDGHFIFTAPSGQRHWLPEVDRFLRKHGMVSQHQRSL